MRRTGARPIRFALARVTPRLAPPTLLAQVQQVWRQAAGDVFANMCEPISERAGVITVACGSAVWAQELDLLSEGVVARLNDVLGGDADAVRQIRAQALPPGR